MLDARRLRFAIAVLPSLSVLADPTTRPASPTSSFSQPTTAPAKRDLDKLRGLGAMIDYGLSRYYRDRTPRGIAKEIRHAGFSWVLCYAHSLTPELAQALRDEQLAFMLQLWGTIIYGPQTCQPPPPETALQRFASGPQKPGASPRFYCPSSDEFIAWHERYARPLLQRYRPDAVLVIEAFMGDLPGPEAPTYGCVCERCRRGFAAQHPDLGEIPEFHDTADPRYWRTDKARYDAWVTFRAESLARFHTRIYANIARASPGVTLAGSMLALGQPDGLARVRECNAHDAALLTRSVPWDVFYLQAHWPDWLRPDLQPDEHVRSYEPFMRAVLAAAPELRVGIITDSGSNEAMRRSMGWLRQAQAEAERTGCHGFGVYEYSISRFIYEELPRVVESRLDRSRGEVELVFSKRIERKSALSPEHYTLEMIDEPAVPGGGHPARIAPTEHLAHIDFDGGNIVTLRFARLPAQRNLHLCITGVTDDPARYWFNSPRDGQPRYPTQTITPGTRVALR